MNRFYRNEQANPDDLSNVFVPVDSHLWRGPKALSLENLAGILSVKPVAPIHRGINAVYYEDQANSPELPPNTSRVDPNVHVAIDESYIYVWVAKDNRWKRAILAEW